MAHRKGKNHNKLSGLAPVRHAFRRLALFFAPFLFRINIYSPVSGFFVTNRAAWCIL
jgi:hypothetical protein